jgi:aldose 1-epimerase
VLTVHTTEPGLQVFAGTVPEQALGDADERHGRRRGLALEPQHFPDSPNHSHFPSTILEPGAVYRSRTLYQFSTRPAR